MAGAGSNDKRKVLFFIDEYAPTDAERAAADKIKGKVLFRNARAVGPEDTVEAFDDIAGSPIPPQYNAALAAKKQAAADAATPAKPATSAKANPGAWGGKPT